MPDSQTTIHGTTWRPIATAPLDKEVLLAIPFEGTFEVCQGVWLQTEWGYWGDETFDGKQPDYWMPLPKFHLPEFERMFANAAQH